MKNAKHPRDFNSYYRCRAILTPDLRNSQYDYLNVLRQYALKDEVWLDIGCGRRLVPEWIEHASEMEAELKKRAHLLVGLDIDAPSLAGNLSLSCKVLGSIYELPFRDESFSLITANMVVEHVARTDIFLDSVRRLLRPGGRFIFHTPNLLNYAVLMAAVFPEILKKKLIHALEGREEEDVFPTHYRLNALRSIKRDALNHGFSVKELHAVESSPVTYRLGYGAIPELLILKMLRLGIFHVFRSNIIAVLEKM